jgi:hypothetical protein
MTVSGNSSTSRSSVMLVASSCCFLKPLVIWATINGSRVALKISLSLPWPRNSNQSCDKCGHKLFQKIKDGVSKRIRRSNHKATIERLLRNYVPVDVVQSRTMSPTYVVDSMSNWKRRGSFSLPPHQEVLPFMN